MRLACASVYLRIGGVGREGLRPANIEEPRRAANLPSSSSKGWKEGRGAPIGMLRLPKCRRQMHQQSPVV